MSVSNPISLSARSNNFDALRFLFATSVILNHSYFAIDIAETHDPLYRIFHQQVDLGSLAVNAFFAISGFLITLSWMRAPRFGHYIRKRALRIYPGYLVCFAFCMLVAAPLSGVHWIDILGPLHLAKHIYKALVISVPSVNHAFEQLPIPNLNVSLWTIRYEFQCYLLVPLILLLTQRLGKFTVLGAYVAALAWHGSQGTYRLFDDGLDHSLLGNFDVWPRFLCYYTAGMVFAQYKDVIPVRRSLAAAAVFILIVTGLTGGFFLAMATAGVYLLFYVAVEPAIPLANFGKYGDFSYGVYLYGSPIQQLLLLYFGMARFSPIGLFCATFPLTLIAAVMSWHWIESPYLRRKTKTLPPPVIAQPAPIPASAGILANDLDDEFEAVMQ